MKIDSIMVGPIMTNCYLLSDETAGVCTLIDPGDEADRVLDMVSRSGCALQYILLTHGHFDHTTAVRPILERYPDLPVYINEKDVVDGHRGDMELVFSRLPEHNQRYYHDGDTLTLGSLTITVLETPGSAAPAAGRTSQAATGGKCSGPWAGWGICPGPIGSIPATTSPPPWTMSAGRTPMSARA